MRGTGHTVGLPSLELVGWGTVILLFLVWEPQLAVLRVYPWLCAQVSLLAQGALWNAEDQARVGYV